MFVKVFRRKAQDLWVKFMQSFPNVEVSILINSYEAYFIKKKKEGFMGADFYLDYANHLRKQLIF